MAMTLYDFDASTAYVFLLGTQPRNPHFPALWSDPMALSKTSRRK
jgi:hypothetical protein